ncbi:MAG: hypothetical protein IJ243_10445 [Prevotella sp.]|nr:hypothetical protein [Prevotella sp.]
MTKYRGNLSQVARAFGVSRHAVYDWIKKEPDFGLVRDDARGEFLDEVISTARVVALGIPLKDDKGNFAGYQVPPDGSMLRYLLSTLGRTEGFGEHIDVTTDGKALSGATLTPQEAKDLIRQIEESC